MLVVPAATADFDYRYVTPAVPLAAIALAVAVVPRPKASKDETPDSATAERTTAPAQTVSP
jgi:hypothetical protein